MTDLASARQTLAAAHASMMPEAIADHALTLADIIESQNGAIEALLNLVANLESLFETSDLARINAQIAIRQVASLVSANRKKAAHDLLRQAAAVELVRVDRARFDRSLFVAATSWPDIFDPAGSAK